MSSKYVLGDALCVYVRSKLHLLLMCVCVCVCMCVCVCLRVCVCVCVGMVMLSKTLINVFFLLNEIECELSCVVSTNIFSWKICV